ncbi:MAG: hypothetical protein AYP45_16725 [Candidatus Brocadia carolinensis]|uniref:Uncharacterized protein n=1 Tax=Candidatus Brocadia carolinensis TaxID=1004156 RepID=A0A1V4APQ7_9BACT|nr:MAG: hypothetical protein AYP45_16725 [Candidatus Brocadia caroliniensis]
MPIYPPGACRGNCENTCKFLQAKPRTKGGKTCQYWSAVENCCISGKGGYSLKFPGIFSYEYLAYFPDITQFVVLTS